MPLIYRIDPFSPIWKYVYHVVLKEVIFLCCFCWNNINFQHVKFDYCYICAPPALLPNTPVMDDKGAL